MVNNKKVNEVTHATKFADIANNALNYKNDMGQIFALHLPQFGTMNVHYTFFVRDDKTARVTIMSYHNSF